MINKYKNINKDEKIWHCIKDTHGIFKGHPIGYDGVKNIVDWCYENYK